MALSQLFIWLWVLLITAGIGGLQVNKTFVFIVGLAYLITRFLEVFGYSYTFRKLRKS